MANASHELKTPLTAIALNAELLESDRRLAEAGVNPVAAIRRSAERLSGLVDDLLATGGTLEAACKLIDQAGAKVVGCCVLVELSFLLGREKLRPYDVFSLIRY